jgi:cobalt-precorrin-5B (C1)-methyltransferase
MNPHHPSFAPLAPFDLSTLAENGLRRGFTTGTSAAAATKAALTLMLTGNLPGLVNVTLPDGLHFLPVPISPVEQSPGWAAASVIKDGGDDPDQTHRARIVARVRPNTAGKVVFLRGSGVGIVTQPGLRLAIGEPAINATPRAMIRAAVSEVVESDGDAFGLDVEVGCENGEKIAQRTFNPRLGILGGISILGTTGIVEPKSLASFKASIEIYLRVAVGDKPHQIVLSPGNLGQRFARASLDLPLKQIVQMSNFVGFALDSLTSILTEIQHTLPLLWIVGHPGKLAKLLLENWNTHSHHGTSGVEALLGVAAVNAPHLVPLLQGVASTEAAIEKIRHVPNKEQFWMAVENSIKSTVQSRVGNVSEVRVRLFAMDGTALGENQ